MHFCDDKNSDKNQSSPGSESSKDGTKRDTQMLPKKHVKNPKQHRSLRSDAVSSSVGPCVPVGAGQSGVPARRPSRAPGMHVRGRRQSGEVGGPGRFQLRLRGVASLQKLEWTLCVAGAVTEVSTVCARGLRPTQNAMVGWAPQPGCCHHWPMSVTCGTVALRSCTRGHCSPRPVRAPAEGTAGFSAEGQAVRRLPRPWFQTQPVPHRRGRAPCRL